MFIQHLVPWRQPGNLPLTFTLTLLTGLMAGCGQASCEPLASARGAASPVTLPASTPPADAEIAEGATLTVDDVVRRAALLNPTREVFIATREAAQAEILIARAWANPELDISGGRAAPRTGGGSESIYTLELRQRLEWPGKRSSRIDAAQAGLAVADQEIALDALTLEEAVRDACLSLGSAEAQLLQAQAAHAATEQMYAAVERRAAAQEAEPGEVARAKLELITVTAVRDRQQRHVIANSAAVRVWVGGGLPERFAISDALPMMVPVVDRQTAMAVAVTHNPRLVLMRAEMNARNAAHARERQAWMPDLTVGGYSAREADSDNLGLSLGIELPLWNRNQGGVALADAERRKAAAQVRAELQIISRQVDLAWQLYEGRRLAVDAMVIEAKLAAQTALNAKLAAFAAGEASLLDVLDARRAAQAVDEAALDARLAAADAWLTLGRAMGSFTATTIPAGDQP